MYQSSLRPIVEKVEAVKRQLRASAHLRGLISQNKLHCSFYPHCFDFSGLTKAPDANEWRIIDHCAAVTRLYGLYEQYAHELVREYLAYLQKTFTFPQLSEKIRQTYCAGIGKILEKKEGPRYGKIGLSNLIQEYNTALQGNQSYRLEPAAMLMQEQNLRLTELGRLFATCDILDTPQWIEKHPTIVQFFTDRNPSSNAESELKALVEFRNDAAHGALTVDSLVGLEDQLFFADFIIALCHALGERVHKAILEAALSAQTVVRCGEVVNCYKDGSVIVGPVVGSFTVGQTICLRGKSFCAEREILNIQVNGENHQAYDAHAPTELGFLLDARGYKFAELFIFPTISISDDTPQPIPAALPDHGPALSFGGVLNNPQSFLRAAEPQQVSR